MFDFKSLVSSLLTKNTSASDVAQSATLLVQDLPQTEYFTALIEIIKAVSKINADTDMSLKERFKTLLYVDEKSHSIHRELCRDYLQQKPGSKSYLPTILAYWNELTTAYQLCLKLHQSTPNGIPEPQLRLITARGLHHQMRLIARNALRYLKPEGSSWLQAYRFYSQGRRVWHCTYSHCPVSGQLNRTKLRTIVIARLHVAPGANREHAAQGNPGR
ncbi:hypothetical protein [Paludibacterium denitrificans]|uniref:hypothetical protein n=1 Tax=Paludibacterium denitrificans TaxID=2675226 RepID=UPI001E2CF20B|nr:hypothetical protein [Paludibacterium denitrificans]